MTSIDYAAMANLNDFGIVSGSEVRLLIYLMSHSDTANDETLGLNYVQRETNISYATFYRVIGRLQQLGLIEVGKSTYDQRRRTIALTERFYRVVNGLETRAG